LSTEWDLCMVFSAYRFHPAFTYCTWTCVSVAMMMIINHYVAKLPSVALNTWPWLLHVAI
jgi:hypothetical protein